MNKMDQIHILCYADKMTEEKYYTYMLLDPRKDNEPFYVGKGLGSRAKGHLTMSYYHNPFCENVIQSIRKKGLEPEIVKCKINISEEMAFKWEVEMIKKFGRRDNETGCLTNLTDGGEGGPSLKGKTYEQIMGIEKAKIRKKETSERMTGNTYGRAGKGKPKPEKVKEKMSIAAKGKSKSKEHRASMSVAQRGNKNAVGSVRSYKQKADHSATMKGRKWSAERRAIFKAKRKEVI